MSHVYDVRRRLPGRYGDGATDGCFLTVRAAVLPVGHPDYVELLFIAVWRRDTSACRECMGYGTVLTDPESYEEASCTAMFILVWRGDAMAGWRIRIRT